MPSPWQNHMEPKIPMPRMHTTVIGTCIIETFIHCKNIYVGSGGRTRTSTLNILQYIQHTLNRRACLPISSPQITSTCLVRQSFLSYQFLLRLLGRNQILRIFLTLLQLYLCQIICTIVGYIHQL